jgi:copper resistance protein C
MNRRAPILSAVMGLLLLLAGAAPTLAHAELVSSNPGAGSTVTDVRTVTLKFSEALSADESSFKLVGPDGTTIGTGTVVSPRTMKLDGVSIGPGMYTVKWTSAATDGHIERGKFTFTVADATAAPVTPPPTEAPPTEAPATPDAPSSEPVGTAAPSVTPPATAAPAGTDAPASIDASGVTDVPSPAPTAAPAADPASASGTDVLLPILGALVLVGIVGALVLRRSRRA